VTLRSLSPVNVPVIEEYQRAFAEHGNSPAAVLVPKGRQHLRYDALTSHFKRDGFSVLDYGCGLAHLKAYLDERFGEYHYRGADIVPEFVDEVRSKHPDAQVALIGSHEDLIEPVDHVVISGTFNLVGGESAEAYMARVQNALIHLFDLCRVSLSVDFMTDRVDFMQPGAHHVNVEAMYSFFGEKLSRRLRVDQSYMPYEFAIVAFKDNSIVRPQNIYAQLD
jgi:SAM-dependent methyltransferase